MSRALAQGGAQNGVQLALKERRLVVVAEAERHMPPDDGRRDAGPERRA
jgi:hypothetical protein